MVFMVKKLWNYRKNEAVTVEDIPTDEFSKVETVEYRGDKYRVYVYEGSSKLIEDDYVRSKYVYKGDLEDAPLNMFVESDGTVYVNDERVVNDLYENYGEGQYRVYSFGGDKRIENFFKNRFIKKVEKQEA